MKSPDDVYVDIKDGEMTFDEFQEWLARLGAPENKHLCCKRCGYPRGNGVFSCHCTEFLA